MTNIYTRSDMRKIKISERTSRNVRLWFIAVLWCAVMVAIGMVIATQAWGLDKNHCAEALTVGERLTVLEQQNNSLTYDMWRAYDDGNRAGVDVAAESIDINRSEYVETKQTYREQKQQCLNNAK